MAGHITVNVHHSYEPQREDELKLDKGDIVTVTDSSDPDWWMGKKDDGSSGYFPSNFVEPVASSPEESKGDANNETDKTQEDTASEPAGEAEAEAAPVKPIGMARVMEDYAMQGPDELTLHRGGIATLHERYEDGWFKGEINGKVGRFPGECVEEIDMPGRPDLGAQSADIPKVAESSEDGSAPAEPSKPAFKLAAYGIKQGGIGSVLAGGFPALKKTGGAPKKPAEPETKAASPEKPAEPATPAEKEEQQPAMDEPAATQAEPEKPLPIDKFDQEEQPTEKFAAKAIVLHPYDAENEDELNLLRGEYVNVIDKNIDDGWWKGTTERGQTGVFPSNFVKEIEEESIASPPPVRSRKSLASTGSQQSFSTASSSRVSTGISARAPPLPGNRPISSGSRPGSLHEQQSTSTAEVSSPSQPSIPEETTPPPAAAESPSPHAPPAAEPEPVSEKEAKEEPVAKDEEPVKVEQEEEKKEATPPVTSSPVSSPPVPSRPPMPASRASSEASEKPPQPSSRPISDASKPSLPSSRPSSEASEKPPKPASRPSSEASEKPPKPASRPSSEASEKPPRPASRPTSQVESETPESPAAVAAEVPASPEEDVKKDETSPPAPAEEEEQTKEEPEKKEEQEEVPAASTETEEIKSPEEEEKKGLDMQPTGPRLSGPARARPARARRSPATPEARKEEPSQMDMLKEDLAKEREEPSKETEKEAEEEAPAAAARSPAKPVKPIFAKFPTPFGGAAPELKNLKPVQRRMWEPAAAHETTSPEKKEDEEPAPRPTGVRNIASRFNVPSSGNDVLETKLKNFTKNEVDKLRKELQEEREKRVQLEQLVASLAEQVEKLQQQ
ncbi:hypothetical protein BDB00DRAFT_803692 [Zychaea mexicana]|uniref:uncharacterized protein n=1 Tax=Zychaea mexicana TaxID=64656 RepID=UPI0022FDC5A0|nr:uncharacterized protein BDB00DRAFT_803692 [Zychaea mexicana]KAI9497704.1 hypothetical protein BDB00DRAFT_803692 [Zychaea mexicana]